MLPNRLAIFQFYQVVTVRRIVRFVAGVKCASILNYKIIEGTFINHVLVGIEETETVSEFNKMRRETCVYLLKQFEFPERSQ